ncbi:predicted protein [Chaetomium globosum CBS 148.51]|uniref:Uncharacterized protein n=1 Tax=Chaetomium globosum (strain ATCC 6205 / CBS 148.51 / DSM 1962 / NBRC 6347 / NRRL 1970) TaxID=306901 RepID=Q2GT86_CHAGB|nr:uncharacterized protein CHGG_08818 [Chaetomium globosum CBS 148.51]EAQ84804.1 predicted protein [Chaetomium globosum CBS 148.51]
MRKSTTATPRYSSSGSNSRTSASHSRSSGSGSSSRNARAPTAHGSTARSGGGSGGGGGPVNQRYPLNCWHCKMNLDVSTYVCPGVDCGVRPFMACGYPGCSPNAPRHVPHSF